jgi:hypothetical protein
MGSGIVVTIKLDRFYQQFLRGHFGVDANPFIFPNRHDLLLRFEAFLSIAPRDWKPVQLGEEAFHIEIPYMEHKDPNCYNYISKEKNNLFAVRVREFQRMIFHEEFRSLKKTGYNRQECIQIMLEDFGIDQTYFDRVVKEYDRWLISQRQLRYKKNVKKSHQFTA